MHLHTTNICEIVLRNPMLVNFWRKSKKPWRFSRFSILKPHIFVLICVYIVVFASQEYFEGILKFWIISINRNHNTSLGASPAFSCKQRVLQVSLQTYQSLWKVKICKFQHWAPLKGKAGFCL